MPDDWELPADVVIPDHLAWAWRAWQCLNPDRPHAAGGIGPPIPMPIPWRDTVAWCDRYGHDESVLSVCIRAMDKVYLQWRADRAKSMAQRPGQ